jgi:hypothetical protein
MAGTGDPRSLTMVKDRSAWTALMVGALTALGGTPALAQESGAPAPEGGALAEVQAVAVNGTSNLVGQEDPGTTVYDAGIVRVRDNRLVTVELSSDERVSGRAVINVNFDAYPDQSGLPGATQVRYGRMRLENGDGAWEGHFSGSLANGGFVQTYWLEGSGDYEGLSYVVTAGGNGSTWRSAGLIFPGDIPPMGGGNSLPLDAIGRELPTFIAPGE